MEQKEERTDKNGNERKNKKKQVAGRRESDREGGSKSGDNVIATPESFLQPPMFKDMVPSSVTDSPGPSQDHPAISKDANLYHPSFFIPTVRNRSI